MTTPEHLSDRNQRARFVDKVVVVTGGGSGIGYQIVNDLYYEGVTVHKEVFDAIKNISGNVYGLVNNAAINPSRKPILETDVKDWQATLDTNLGGPFYCSRAAIKQMLELGQGSIVNISSVAGIKAFKNRASYDASKAGLLGLTESIAQDYADNNIRANAICPGYVRTKLTESFFESMDKERYQQLVNAHAMRRLGTPQEILKQLYFYYPKMLVL